MTEETSPPTTMLRRLKAMEHDGTLVSMLREPADAWRTLDVIYHPPHVQRVWRQHGDVRIYLHRIWPCAREQALLHPHDWPSAVKLLTGSYEHGIASPGSDGAPLQLVTLELAAGTYYEMSEPRAWHYVRPLGGPALSLMVAGRPYDRGARVHFEKPARRQPPLDDDTRDGILTEFRRLYAAGDGV